MRESEGRTDVGHDANGGTDDGCGGDGVLRRVVGAMKKKERIAQLEKRVAELESQVRYLRATHGLPYQVPVADTRWPIVTYRTTGIDEMRYRVDCQ